MPAAMGFDSHIFRTYCKALTASVKAFLIHSDRVEPSPPAALSIAFTVSAFTRRLITTDFLCVFGIGGLPILVMVTYCKAHPVMRQGQRLFVIHFSLTLRLSVLQ